MMDLENANSPRRQAVLPTGGRPRHDGADQSPWRQRFKQIHRRLQERITLLHYPPGTRLDLDALAREFEVSRTPIRSVLQRLEHEGMVQTRHGVGTRVSEIDYHHLREATLLRMHLAELIGILDPLPASQETLETLDGVAARLRAIDAAPDYEAFSRADLSLHACVRGIIGNVPLRRTYDELFFRAVRMWFSFLPRVDWPREVGALVQHVELTRRALEHGDAKAVGYITRNAISDSLVRIDDLLREVEHV
jgi:DNA-binding GntR family transcriptional regulator